MKNIILRSGVAVTRFGFCRLSFCFLSIAVSAMSHGALSAEPGTNEVSMPTEVPAEVRVQLQKQADALALSHIEYTETQSGPALPEYYGGPIFYKAYFNSNQFYLHTDYLYSYDKGVRRKHEDAFDGTHFFYGDPDRPESNLKAILKKYLPTDSTDTERFTPLHFRYLEAAGFYPPQSIAALKDFQGIQSLVLYHLTADPSVRIENDGQHLRVTVQAPDSLILRAKGMDIEGYQRDLEGGKNTPQYIAREVDSLKQMRAMEPFRRCVYLLDPRKGYCVVSREDFTQAGQKIVSVKCDDWEYYDSVGIWLPKRCVESYFSDRFSYTDFSEEPRLIVTFNLTSAEFGRPTGVSYALDYKEPSSLIVDRASAEARSRPDHAVTYLVSANGDLLRHMAMDAMPEVKSQRKYLWMSLFGGLLALPAVVLVAHGFKKSRQG